MPDEAKTCHLLRLAARLAIQLGVGSGCDVAVCMTGCGAIGCIELSLLCCCRVSIWREQNSHGRDANQWKMAMGLAERRNAVGFGAYA